MKHVSIVPNNLGNVGLRYHKLRTLAVAQRTGGRGNKLS